jgi:hypothetical protein
MILARFVYTDHILGEWTEIRQHQPMMVPNPEYASRLIGVEFMESQTESANVSRGRRNGRAFRMETVTNGEP